MKRAYCISKGALTGIFTVALGCGVGDADTFFAHAGAGGSGGAGSGDAMTTTSSASAGAGRGATTASSGSGTPASSSSAASSSSSSGGGATLPCGTVACPLGGLRACCWDTYKLHDGPQAECVQGSAAEDNCATEAIQDGLETRIECHDSTQCEQKICCGQRASFNQGQFSYFDLVTCKESCPPLGTKLCDPKLDSQCPVIDTPTGPKQTVCRSDDRLPPGYFICGLPK
jgi:hypothetical protein